MRQLVLIFGFFWWVGEVEEIMVPSPALSFHKIPPKMPKTIYGHTKNCQSLPNCGKSNALPQFIPNQRTYHLVWILMDVVLKKVLIFLICCPYILGKRPYKHQNETIGLYLSLIFGIFLGVGEGWGLMVQNYSFQTHKWLQIWSI